MNADGHSHRDVFTYLLVFMFVLFFFSGPDYYASRHYKALWNLGHIIFFAVLPFYMFERRKWWLSNFRSQSVFTIAVCVFLGTAVEFFQYGFQRTPDIGDIFRDIIGGFVGLFFLLPSRQTLNKKIYRWGQIITVFLVALQIYPVFVAFVDEYLSCDRFPILSNFETPWELSRWRGDADCAIADSVHWEGRHAMRLRLNNLIYSGVQLFYFPRNWKSFKTFRFSINNPSDQTIEIICRINDMRHEHGMQLYEDRFNRRYTLTSGWHTIEISLEDVRNAPKGREMDLDQIAGVGIFAVRIKQSRLIYIDDVRLSE